MRCMRFFGVFLALAVLFSGLLITSVPVLATDGNEPSPIAVVPPDTPVEPGSIDSYYYYVEANQNLIDKLAQEPGILGWGDATISYALDMKSIFDAYSLWYDNQDQNGDGVPPITNQLWECALASPNGGNLITLPATLTGYTGNGNTYAYQKAYNWANLPYGGYVMSHRIPKLLSQANLDSLGKGNYSYSGLSFQVWTNWLGASDRETQAFQYVFYYKTFTADGNDDWNNPPPNKTDKIYLYNPHNVDGMSFTYVQGVSDINQMYQDVVNKHPDADKELVDIPPPMNDVEWEENPEEHPDGCHCECHVTVDVTVNIDFTEPTMDELVQPSDFNFSPFDKPEMTVPEIQEHVEEDDALFGGMFDAFELLMSTWSNFMDLIGIKHLLITFAVVGLVLYLIM